MFIALIRCCTRSELRASLAFCSISASIIFIIPCNVFTSWSTNLNSFCKYTRSSSVNPSGGNIDTSPVIGSIILFSILCTSFLCCVRRSNSSLKLARSLLIKSKYSLDMLSCPANFKKSSSNWLSTSYPPSLFFCPIISVSSFRLKKPDSPNCLLNSSREVRPSMSFIKLYISS